MLHHPTGVHLHDHYGVSMNSLGHVLVQLQDQGEQVRIPLTPDEARLMAKLLLLKADAAENELLDDPIAVFTRKDTPPTDSTT